MSLSRADIGIWLINLPRATGRRAAMEAGLERIGITDHRLFPGIDGKTEAKQLAKSTDIPAFERNMGRRFLWAEIACYHAHLAVWREFLATDAPIALVLEDDVVFHDDFVAAVETALRGAEHWDFLKLNCIRAKLPIAQGLLGDYRLNAYLGPATGTAAYLIKRETAARLLSRMLPVTRPIDHEINRFFAYDFRLFGLEPFPSHVDDEGQSQITGASFGDVAKFPKWQRLPYYRLKAGNYFRRAWWLLRKGFLRSRPGHMLALTTKAAVFK